MAKSKSARREDKRKRNAEKRARRNSTLADHRRAKKMLLPPIMQRPVTLTSWIRDALPDFLWIAAVADHRGSAGLCHAVLNVLDEIVPAEVVLLDGRLSTFDGIPVDIRGAVIEALRVQADAAMPRELAHGLLLYPNCPARWLVEAVAGLETVDPAVGLPYLQRLLRPLMDHRDVPATRLRMLPLARRTKHGRMIFARSIDTVAMLPAYPDGLNVEEQRRVESWTRATYNVVSALEPADGAGREWAKHFWRHNWRISPCQPVPSGIELPPEDDGTGDPGPWAEHGHDDPTTSGDPQPVRARSLEDTLAAILKGLGQLSDALEELQERAEVDLYDPTRDEVRLGLAARQVRLLGSLSEDPGLWGDDMAPLLVRTLAEARILVAWLLRRDDTELYARFKEYGLGKLKLFKLHLEDWLDDNGPSPNDEERLRQLEANVNSDVMEEFIKIDLGGNFAGVDLRKMAEEVDLKPVYTLIYQPLSADAHGEWGTLLKFDFRRCGNPLHRYHRRGAFMPGRVEVNPGWLRVAFELARDCVCDVFGVYGLDATPPFERFSDRVRDALGIIAASDPSSAPEGTAALDPYP